MTADLLTLLSDALFALANNNIEPELQERIREALEEAANPQSNVERGDRQLFDEMGF